MRILRRKYSEKKTEYRRQESEENPAYLFHLFYILRKMAKIFVYNTGMLAVGTFKSDLESVGKVHSVFVCTIIVIV
jgi:hypothetical protein